MEVGDFQYVTGLLQFALALHIGFIVTDGFRNAPKKKFDTMTQNWVELTKLSGEGDWQTRQSDVDKSINDGEHLLIKKVAHSLCWVVILFVGMVAISFAPLFKNSLYLAGDFGYYTFWIGMFLGLGSCVHLFYTYRRIVNFWRDELGHLQRAVAIK